MDARLISSQRYTDDTIVEAKRAAKDYEASYVWLTVEGEGYRLVTDGHHSLAAAKLDGAEPAYKHDAESQRELDYMGAERFLAERAMDADYYYLDSGSPVW